MLHCVFQAIDDMYLKEAPVTVPRQSVPALLLIVMFVFSTFPDCEREDFGFQTQIITQKLY